MIRITKEKLTDHVKYLLDFGINGNAICSAPEWNFLLTDLSTIRGVNEHAWLANYSSSIRIF